MSWLTVHSLHVAIEILDRSRVVHLPIRSKPIQDLACQSQMRECNTSQWRTNVEGCVFGGGCSLRLFIFKILFSSALSFLNWEPLSVHAPCSLSCWNNDDFYQQIWAKTFICVLWTVTSVECLSVHSWEEFFILPSPPSSIISVYQRMDRIPKRLPDSSLHVLSFGSFPCWSPRLHRPPCSQHYKGSWHWDGRLFTEGGQTYNTWNAS